MSTNESMSEATDLSAEQAITIQPSGVAAYTGAADWMASGESETSPSGMAGPAALFNALRRHWLVMIATGIAAAAVLGTTVWLVQKPKYEATATLLISATNPHILNGSLADEERVGNEFEIFRSTQAALLKQRFVLTAALRNSKMKNLACIQREDAQHNTLAWLTSVVQVELGKNSSIMNVSVTLPDGGEAATIVNSVVEAYMDEVVNRDRQARRERLDSLQRISGEKEAEVRVKREQLKRELEQIGAGDDQTASVRGQMAVSIYAEYQRELQKMRWDRTALQGRLDQVNETAKAMESIEISDTEVAAVLNNDPRYRDLLPRLQMLEQIKKAQDMAMVKGAKGSMAYQRAFAELKASEDQMATLKSDAKEGVRGAKRIELVRESRRLEAELRIASEQVRVFEKEVEAKSREADLVGRSSVAAQMARADVDNVERILHGVAEERERLKVELNSALRVTIPGDKTAPAAVPDAETGLGLRYMMIAMSSLVGLCLPAFGIIVWDLRRQRINSPDDVAKTLKIRVMGTLPFIPATIMRRLGNTSRRSQIWKMRYTEAVDGVAARLLRSAECDQTRTVLVTSAMSGEGKTWLATQLAMGLARAQRRTVLVDFDLRQPSLDGALGLPLGPGVCEALRGQGEIAQMAQATDTEFLSVVTAGRWNRQVLPALANGSVGTVLEQLRENFDFVIIDSSPLLPIVDTRLVCQHVDAVLLSVLRDVSEGGKVLAAQEMLDAFGVGKVEAVVTGGEQYGDAKSLLYQAALIEEHHARLTDEPASPHDESAPQSDDEAGNS